jgi:hypothetical protein
MIIDVSADTLNTFTKKKLEEYKPLKKDKGRKLKLLETAMLSDVHLAKPVKYFDIKRYDIQGKYKGGWSFDSDAYNKLSAKEKKKIRLAASKKSHDSFWHIYMNDGPEVGFYNLHYIDVNANVNTIASRKELLLFLGTIDTPAEVSMLLLGGQRGKIRYKKRDDFYIFRIHEVSYTDCDGCGEPACTLYVRHRMMDNLGNILIDKQISEQGFKSEKECNKL